MSSTKLALFTLTSSLSDAGTVTLRGPRGLSEGESGLRERRADDESCVVDLFERVPLEGATAVDFERAIINFEKLQ